jgi:hypothetical protein
MGVSELLNYIFALNIYVANIQMTFDMLVKAVKSIIFY